jgi:hypothetical protein
MPINTSSNRPTLIGTFFGRRGRQSERHAKASLALCLDLTYDEELVGAAHG